jgi:hypothetical protein
MTDRLRVTLCALLLLPIAAQGQQRIGADGGKLLLTAGFSDVEGAGGGGLVPWALITGYGSNQSWGANAHYTDIRLNEYTLRTAGYRRGDYRSPRGFRHAARSRGHRHGTRGPGALARHHRHQGAARR